MSQLSSATTDTSVAYLVLATSQALLRRSIMTFLNACGLVFHVRHLPTELS